MEGSSIKTLDLKGTQESQSTEDGDLDYDLMEYQKQRPTPKVSLSAIEV